MTEQVIMVTPDNKIIPVHRRKVAVKKSWGWKLPQELSTSELRAVATGNGIKARSREGIIKAIKRKGE